MRIVVLHRSLGCDTGCCGHIIEIDDVEQPGFHYEHPLGEDFEKWARALVEENFQGHGADLDFANCEVVDD